MSKSLPPVSQKLIADAEQFIAEFRRAERAAQKSGAGVAAEVDRMAKSLSKKFTLGDIGKDILKGFGVGSGFAVVDTVLGKVTEAYDKHQEQLKEIDNIWARVITKSREYWLSTLPQKDQVTELQKELDELVKKRDQLVAPKPMQVSIVGPGYVSNSTVTPTFGSTSDWLEYAKITEQIAEAATKLGQAQTRLAADNRQDAEAQYRALADAAQEMQKAYPSIKALKEVTDEQAQHAWEAAQRALQEMADEDFQAALERARLARESYNYNDIASRKEISPEQEVAAYDAANKAIREMQDEADKAKAGLVDFADGVNSFFEDAIASGKDLGDVVKDLGSSIATTFLKLALINPIMNGIFGGAKGWNMLPTFGGGKASGGPIDAGRPYLVGEQGPELIVPRAAGNVIPNHELGGGKTYYIDARGTDASVVNRLAAALQQLAGPGVVEQRALGAMMNHRARGATA